MNRSFDSLSLNLFSGRFYPLPAFAGGEEGEFRSVC